MMGVLRLLFFEAGLETVDMTKGRVHFRPLQGRRRGGKPRRSDDAEGDHLREKRKEERKKGDDEKTRKIPLLAAMIRHTVRYGTGTDTSRQQRQRQSGPLPVTERGQKERNETKKKHYGRCWRTKKVNDSKTQLTMIHQLLLKQRIALLAES